MNQCIIVNPDTAVTKRTEGAAAVIEIAAGAQVEVRPGTYADYQRTGSPPAQSWTVGAAIPARPGMAASAADALLGGGEGRGYAGGGVGGAAPETVGQDVGRRFTYEYHGEPGGEYPLDYPNRNMYRALVHCNAAGLHIYGPFVPTAERKPGPNVGAIKTAENLTGNLAGIMAISTTKSMADAIVSTRNMLTPNLTFVVDEPVPDGVNVSLKAGEPYYVLVQVNTPADYMIEPRAHNAG